MTKPKAKEIHIHRKDDAWWVQTTAPASGEALSKELDIDPGLTAYEVIQKVQRDSAQFPEIDRKLIFVMGIPLSSVISTAPKVKVKKARKPPKTEAEKAASKLAYAESRAHKIHIGTLDLFKGCDTQAGIARLVEERSPLDGKFTQYSTKAVEHVITRIYQRHVEERGGFSEIDMKLGFYYAEWILGMSGPNEEGNRLTGGHLRKARQMAKKYRKQMLEELTGLRQAKKVAS